jgi:hypothetical protein
MAAKFKDSRILNWIALVLLGLFPIFLWLVPSGTFDDTGVIICPSRFLFDIECFGCGITRAVLHIHHFEFEEAVYYNPLIIAVYPGLIYIWYRWMRYLLGNLDIVKK